MNDPRAGAVIGLISLLAGCGGTAPQSNSAPRVARGNGNVVVEAHRPVDYDATQSGATFRDDDRQPLTFRVTLLSPPSGLTVRGTHLVGTLAGPGYVKAKIEAHDPRDASAVDYFALVVPAPVSSRPSLPAESFVYEDATRGKIHWDDTIPNDNPVTNAGATLGRVLFYDKRLSVTNTHACASCHEQAHGFASSVRFPQGALGAPTARSPMALANVRFNSDDRHFSDERTGRLETAVAIPIEDREELGSSMPALVHKLAATDFYPPLFNAAFGTPEVSADRITRALAQFLRSMISDRSRYDRAQFTAQEKHGAEIYRAGRCEHCHELGGFEVRWPANNGLDAVFTDPGVTSGRFRAASLRNIAVSAPYMHDGRFATLREVIDHYDSGLAASAELDVTLRDGDQPRRMHLGEQDKQALEAFLGTLTDDAFLHDPKFSDPFQ